MQARPFAVFSLVAFAVAGVAQCAPGAPKTSMYDTLVNLTMIQKCTYLQNTTLLHADLRFLRECGSYEDVLVADTSSIYDTEKLHCLLYYESFSALCEHGDEGFIKRLVSEAALKTGDRDITNVCNDLHRFYQSNNVSKIGRAFQRSEFCERFCRGLDGSLMKACAYSALMTNIHKPPVAQDSRNQPNALAGPLSIIQKPPTSTADSNLTGMNEPVQHLASAPNSPNLNANSPKAYPPVLQINQTLLKTPVDSKIPGFNIPLNKTNALLDKLPGLTQSEKLIDSSLKKDETTTALKTAIKVDSSQPAQSTGVGIKQTSKAADKPVKPQVDVKNPSIVSSSTAKADKPEDEAMPVNYEDEDREMPAEEAEQSTPSPKEAKPLQTSKVAPFNGVDINNDDDLSSNDSYFFSYFMMFCILFVMGYVGYHNKQKILALVLEGRRGRRQPRRRPNSANYHKLDSNLEEAVTSSCDKTTSNVIY